MISDRIADVTMKSVTISRRERRQERLVALARSGLNTYQAKSMAISSQKRFPANSQRSQGALAYRSASANRSARIPADTVDKIESVDV